MSLDAMEIVIIIVAAALIIGALWETGKILLRNVEANRERERQAAWQRRQPPP